MVLLRESEAKKYKPPTTFVIGGPIMFLMQSHAPV